MFPKANIRKIVKNAIFEDRMKVPVFISNAELHDMYLFECTVSFFDKEKQKFDSVLEIPLTIYSERMKTIDIPSLDVENLNDPKICCCQGR